MKRLTLALVPALAALSLSVATASANTGDRPFTTVAHGTAAMSVDCSPTAPCIVGTFTGTATSSYLGTGSIIAGDDGKGNAFMADVGAINF